MMNNKAPCDVCIQTRKPTEDPIVAILKCYECDKFLCAKCTQVHKSLLKFHTLIKIPSTGPAKVNAPIVFFILKKKNHEFYMSLT